MTEREPAETTNLDRYGNAALPWSRARDIVTAPAKADAPASESRSYLATSRPDGRPHAARVGAIWHDDDLYFVSGPGTRKSRNLAANPACTIAMGLEGIDLVFEGTAARVTDPATLETVAAAYRQGGGRWRSRATPSRPPTTRPAPDLPPGTSIV